LRHSLQKNNKNKGASMLVLYRLLFLMIFFVFSQFSLATSALTEHGLSVSQSMSAFYMYSLTDGDARYRDDYEKYLNLADQSLVDYHKQDSLAALELKNTWQNLRPQLKFEFVDGAGFIIPVAIRNEYRRYLSLVYKKISEVVKSETNISEQLSLMALNVEVMSARFFDISSALYGTMSISSNDSVDPVKMASNFTKRLNRFKQMSLSSAIKKDLGAAGRKWDFIEDKVINYKGEAAYFLVYYNKRQISKLLHKSQVRLAGA